jgi:O-antigen/teichoic acid export membrane protein
VIGRATLRAARHLQTPLYRDAYALVVSSGLTSALGVAYWALAARYFAPEEIGIAAVLLSTLVLLSSLTQLNARVALVRFVPEAGRRSGRFVALWYLSTGFLGIFVGILFIATLGFWTSASPSLAVLNDPYLGPWFVASIAIWSFFNLQDGLLTGLGKATIVPFENGAYASSKLLLLALLASWAGPAAVLVSWTLPAAVVVAVVSSYAFARWIPKHAAQTEKRTLSMSTPALARFLALDYIAYVLAVITATLLPMVVVAFGGPAQGGYFYIPWVILTSLMLVPVYLSTSLTVQAASDPLALAGNLRPVLMHVLRLLIPIVLGILLVAPLILAIFGPSYAEEGSNLLRVASVGLIPYAVNVLYLGVARVRGLGRVIVAAQASLTVLTLGLSVALLPVLGIVGAGIAWTAANAMVAVIVFQFGLRPLLIRHSGESTSLSAR